METLLFCSCLNGMHELLAPLLYVLHVDVEHLAEVRKIYEDHFTDKFDGLSFQESDLTYNFDFKKFLDSMEDETGSQGNSKKVKSLDELDPEIQTIVLLTDAYGAEGELGVVLSEKFMEHDAYCMFDALMSGGHGSVAMAEFFAYSSASGSHAGSSPVIEASAALYHLLSVVDSSLHSHLSELGVEPQYFALRWLRVLFGREFSLEDLLIVWDEIFAADNSKSDKGVQHDFTSSFGILKSPRGALIAAMAVSMILYLRSSLLATENATTCLQRLLNFPANIDLRKLIEKAKSLKTLALDAIISSSSPSFNAAYNQSKSMVVRGHSLPSDSVSPKTPLNVVPDSYWEEKWRVLHKAEEQRQGSSRKQNPGRRKGWSEKVRLSLSRTESDPCPAKIASAGKEPKSSVRRSLLEDLSREIGANEDGERVDSSEVPGQIDCQYVDIDCHEVPSQIDHHSVEVEVDRPKDVSKDFGRTAEESCLIGNAGSEENSSIFSDSTSPVRGANEHENDSEKSSVASNLSLDENDDHLRGNVDDSPLPVSYLPAKETAKSQLNNDLTGKSIASLKERKLLAGKFQWFWKFGRSTPGEEASEKGGGVLEGAKSADSESSKSNVMSSSTSDGLHNSSSGSKGEVDQNVISTLSNLGQSMLEHIQVIESVFQQDRGQVGSRENFSKNVLVGKGQVTAMNALKELRKISNLLSEM